MRALAGLAGGLVVIAVAELIAAPINPHATPFIAVGDEVVRRTPLAFERWAIEQFGTHDKQALFVVMVVVAVGVSALAGVLERRRRPAGSVLFALFGLLSALAAMREPFARPSFLVPSLIGAAAGIVVLRALTARLPDTAAQESATPASAATGRTTPGERSDGKPTPASAATERQARAARADRREFLQLTALIAAGSALAGLVGRWWGSRLRDVSADRAAVRLPAVAEPLAPVAPPGADLQLPGLTRWVTPNSGFYLIDTALVKPQVATRDWSLRIHGMVDREVTLSWADLAAREPVERFVTLACVSNPVGGDLVGNARWLGYPIKDLLSEAGVRPGADMVLSTSEDGWTAGTPLAALMDGRDALLAIGMNGEPLPIEHGFPARLVVPGLYGYVSATKWVRSLEVTRFDRAEAYWTRNGWSAKGPVKTGCRIDAPTRTSGLSPGPVKVAGVAWAQHSGINLVEVQVDDGPWRPAQLADQVTIDSWRQWVYDWEATPGSHVLRARATNGANVVQTSEIRDVVPDGATGYPVKKVQIAAA